MRVFMLLGLGIGFYTGDTGIIVNSLVSFSVTFVPALIERDYGIEMNPLLVLWLTSAVFLHAAGTLGPYGTVWWWDHLTHTLSSSVVAGAGYATIRAIDEHYEQIHLPSKLFFIFILLFVVAFGVVWELLEFGISGAAEILGGETVLTQYGLEDTMKDLIFDISGGLVVALFGEVYLTDTVEQIKQKLIETEL
ncbi:hypothetical protein [Candidatus Nanohalococcus occultus]|uniref:Membrane protein n=1 Tax=Candidatus Nanohalococcus occultus TaxID=2978047 RepID=A0ABY8CEK5_9ARCH|nr:putative membrane protein [Candidatus Nanohaloarchaeota archaeon SVXNc]